MITIPDQYFEQFEKIGEKTYFQEKQNIIMQDDQAKNIYLILSGRVRVYSVSQEGKELTFEVLKKGRIFGDHSFIEHAIRNISIEAVTDTEIVICEINKVLPLLHHSMELMTLMFQHLTETSEHLVHQIKRLVYYNSEQKVIDFLIQLSETSPSISYSQQEIADCLGLNRVTVTRVIQLLKKQLVIQVGYGCVTVLNREALIEMLKGV